MGGDKRSPGAASKDGEEVGEMNKGVVEMAKLAFPFNPTVVSSPEFVGGVRVKVFEGREKVDSEERKDGRATQGYQEAPDPREATNVKR